MPDQVHIEISVTVREQLRCLEPPFREAIVDGLYRSLPVNGRLIRLSNSDCRVYSCLLERHAFFFRELTPKERARIGTDFGYYLFAMKELSPWIQRQLGG